MSLPFYLTSSAYAYPILSMKPLTCRRSLVWHRVYFPYIPYLPEMRNGLVALSAGGNSSSTLLFALLCLMALDAPGNRLTVHRHLQNALQNIVSSYGWVILY